MAIDLENESRYQEFLDEVAREVYGRAYDPSYDNEWELHSIAQRRYFEEKFESLLSFNKSLVKIIEEFANSDLLSIPHKQILTKKFLKEIQSFKD